MTLLPGAGAGLPLLLALLATYHLAIGLISLASTTALAGTTSRLYGLNLADAPQFRYATKMLGLYALVFGGLLACAAWDPRSHRELVVALIVLQTLRACCRLGYGELLRDAFGVQTRANVAGALLLLLEVAFLIAWFPRL